MNLLIVDDHEIVRDGLSMILQQAYCIDATEFASDGYEAIRIAESFPADLVLLDVSMSGGLDGLLTLEKMRKQLPDAKIVIFSMFEDISFQKRAYENGADGYLIKQLRRDALVQSLDQILANHKVFNSSLLGTATTSQNLDLPITKREKEVFILTVMGYTLKDIANKLAISHRTVENYRQKIGEKLETQKRHEWIEIARNYHLL
ncbi:response regulator transcription factor [Neobacillus niacini]|uniref:response regulator transcription factor n=1 Tax=Neobacillus niacini TaxID=86668 RepID=UPI0005EDD173|nr:response regulator transcription factor [Neobacillus niacini]